MCGMRESSDAFGQALLDWVHGGTTPEIIERDDGVIEIGAGAEVYLMEGYEWPVAEQEAMHYVRGRAADLGCGGGRVALHLQQLGCKVVGIDSSPLAIKAARLHGVSKTLRMSVDDVKERIEEFDTIIMFGNNLGVFGTPRRAKRILTSWAKKAPSGTRLLLESTNPLSGGAPVVDKAYCARNREKGVAIGQCRLRVWYDRSPTAWFNWFFVSRSEMKRLLSGTGWTQVHVATGAADEPYVAIYEVP
jgi:SAM-dependent methyltransferase